MPSPTSTTVPTSADSAWPSNRRICALMMSVISVEVAIVGLSFYLVASRVRPCTIKLSSPLSSTCGQLLSQRAQLCVEGCVDEMVAELDLRAADERRID